MKVWSPRILPLLRAAADAVRVNRHYDGITTTLAFSGIPDIFAFH